MDALCVAFSECKSLFRGPIDGVMYAEHVRCKDGSIMMVVFDIVRWGLVDMLPVTFRTRHRPTTFLRT